MKHENYNWSNISRSLERPTSTVEPHEYRIGPIAPARGGRDDPDRKLAIGNAYGLVGHYVL